MICHTLPRAAALLCLAPAFAACLQNNISPAGELPTRVKLGYTVASSAAQQQLETRFRQGVSADSMSALHKPLTARPHPAGSAGTQDVVRYLQQTLAGYGLDVQTHEYQVLLAKPKAIAITMTAPARRALSIDEPAIPEDPTSSHPELGGGYVAYSASGTAEGQVVYVNYGLPADYAELATLGVSVKGKIALARYGRSHRAVKTHTAERAGARAVILYSDPGDDGEAKGPAWPKGYWRGQHMLQRGNAKYSWYWHGDPLTPGVGATKDAVRIPEATAPTLPKIPVVVVSWGEAQHLMAALGGPNAPERFHGGLRMPYKVGPGPAAVRVQVEMDQGLRPIYDVVASLRGASTPERSILFGTHHDAWTFGGVDPGTGATALLEVAKGLGQLAKTGWKPSRTIAFAFWDAEEFGLVGSTEYAEALSAQLQEQLIMYVNIDMYMKGRFDPGGVPSLAAFVADVAKDVPEGDATVYERWKVSEAARQKVTDTSAFTPDLEALGSGADFVPFQDHLAVPTMAIEFIGDNGYGFGTYHSNYDSRAYVEQIADPGFTQGVLMAQVLGTMALRMSEAEVLPFRFSHYATKLLDAVDAASGWSRDAGVAMDAAPLRDRAEAVRVASVALEQAIDAALAVGGVSSSARAALNDRLSRMEQTLADDDGAADTKWYRHVFYGWNIYSLYDGQPLPGLAEAFRLKDAARVTHELGRIQRALDRMHGELLAARRLVN
ncbi:MAG: M28 family peptidase [Acidimicrobiia bacterium]|nr:M28 family peptidase [Acidimicrobiia bacterium]